jgi:hypothetical protein
MEREGAMKPVDKRDVAAEPAACVYCGATENLVADDHLEGLYYCPTCLDRHLRHGQQIDDRGEAEPPWDG